jgi:hypothetical protein
MHTIVAFVVENQFLAQIRKTENRPLTILLLAMPNRPSQNYPPTLVAFGNTTQEDDDEWAASLEIIGGQWHAPRGPACGWVRSLVFVSKAGER